MSKASATHDSSGLLRPGTGHGHAPLPAPSSASSRRWAHALWERWNDAEPFVVPPRSQWPAALRRARVVGLCLLGIQLLGLCWWSSVLAGRYALTWDYAIYAQAAHLIAAGHIDPYSTLEGFSYWRDHSAFMMWPIALVASLWPHPVTLLWLQDAATVAMLATALLWICDIAAARSVRMQSTRAPLAIVALGTVLLLASPWTVWASSFDFHIEAFSALCAVATARNLFLERRRAWLWALLTLSTGNVGATYLAAVGASAALSGRRRMRRGGAVALLGVAWFAFISAVHGALGNSASIYARILGRSPAGAAASHDSMLQVLRAASAHPGRALSALWSNRIDVWANLSPGGLVGILWAPVLVPLAVVLAESQLAGYEFSYPGVQNIAVIPLVAIGTAAMFAALLSGRPLGRARRWLASALFLVLVLNAVAWAAIWVPHAGERWLSVSPGAARTLGRVRGRIGANDEVIASQGIVGAFADHEYVYSLGLRERIPVHARKVWVIFAPTQGIELTPSSAVYADVASFVHEPGARLVASSNGIWAFEWHPSPGTRSLSLRTLQASETPGWTLAGEAGEPVLDGPPGDWHTASTAHRGYVVDHAYWRERPGAYRATVTLSVSESANVEVWNATTSQLLSRQSVPATGGMTTVRSAFTLASAPAERIFSGWGIWRTDVVEPPGDQLEIRVWSSGGNDIVNVYRAGLGRAG